MPRKKITTPTAAEAVQEQPRKETITLSLEVTPELYRQMQAVAAICGLSVDEWVRDALANGV